MGQKQINSNSYSCINPVCLKMIHKTHWSTKNKGETNMVNEIMTTNNFEEQITAIDSKFNELSLIAFQKINTMSLENIEKYETVLLEQNDKLNIRITAIRALKSGSWIQEKFFEEKVKPYLLSVGFNPISGDDDHQTVKKTNAKGKEIEIKQIRVRNNLTSDWQNKDKILSVIDVLESVKLPIDLKNELESAKLKMQSNNTDKIKVVFDASILKKYSSDFSDASHIADKEFADMKKTSSVRGYYLKVSKSFINAKLNMVAIRKSELKISKKDVKAQDSEKQLINKYGKKPVTKYGSKTESCSQIAKKFGLIL